MIRKTKAVKRGLESLWAVLSITLETPSDNVAWECSCEGCRSAEDCLCITSGKLCDECQCHADAELAMQWLNEHVFNFPST